MGQVQVGRCLIDLPCSVLRAFRRPAAIFIRALGEEGVVATSVKKLQNVRPETWAVMGSPFKTPPIRCPPTNSHRSAQQVEWDGATFSYVFATTFKVDFMRCT